MADNFCASFEVTDHNSSISFTEEMLTSCSCEVVETKSAAKLETIFTALGFTMWIVFTVSVLYQPKDQEPFFSAREGRYPKIKNGKTIKKI
jgi:hypothetical protein